jgi:carbon starvation protein
MHGSKFMWITCVPLVWLVIVTFSAATQKIFSDNPAIGFLAQARKLTGQAAFNARLDAIVCAILLFLVAAILIDSVRVWAGIPRGTREARIAEAPFVLSQLRAEEL